MIGLPTTVLTPKLITSLRSHTPRSSRLVSSESQAKIVNISDLTKMGVPISLAVEEIKHDGTGAVAVPTLPVLGVGEGAKAEVVGQTAGADTGGRLISVTDSLGRVFQVAGDINKFGLIVPEDIKPGTEMTAGAADVPIAMGTFLDQQQQQQAVEGATQCGGAAQPLTTAASQPTVIEVGSRMLGSVVPEAARQQVQLEPQHETLNRVANLTFPAQILEEISLEYKTASRYDAIWKCNGGQYKVHKLVLALSSPYLWRILQDQPDDTKSVIETPDFNPAIVKAILCLFYTGKVNIAKGIIGQVNSALKLLGFKGANVTALPKHQLIKQELVLPDYESGLFEGASVHKSSRRLKQEAYESDDNWNVDSAFDTGIQGSDSDDEYYVSRRGRATKRRIKTERWSDEDEDYKPSTGFKRGRKSLKTPDTHESFRTRGPGKGNRSYQLAEDLLDRHVDFIYVCHACYKIFDTHKKLALHKDDAHPANPDARGPSHTDNPNHFKCHKCNEVIAVKHIAWFCKHLKYCRENLEMAKAVQGPDDPDSDGEECKVNGPSKRKYVKKSAALATGGAAGKDTPDRLRVTGEGKGKNVKTMSRLLLGKIVDYIYACRVCYSVFETEADLTSHREQSHGPEEKEGRYWNANTENYTCPTCNQVQNSRHVAWFVHHMRKCNVGNGAGTARRLKNEEEDTDEDDDEPEVTDPEGIVFKTYKIKGERAEWICQALLGRLVERIYPCHVCYVFYETENELRSHFRSSHPGVPGNRARNGLHYDKLENLYNCPNCSRQVCKKQANSIFFIYHYRRCTNQTYHIEKRCPECEKEFSLYPSYKQHVEAHSEVRNFMCHVCTKAFPSNARLNYHVQYVHSTYKPFQCSKCTKSYKRKAELLEHEEMSHSTNFNYSCEKCGKQFYGKKNLALHMKTHYTEEEKKHVCKICGYRFAKIKFLKNHLTTHSDVRQFACEVCGARVKTRDTLKQHRKKLHNLLTPVPKTAALPAQPSAQITTEVIIS